MSHEPNDKYDFAFSIRKQLESDPHMQDIAKSTTFRDIPLDRIPLATLEDIYYKTNIKRLQKTQRLNLREEGEVLFEILSGYVKICDGPEVIVDEEQPNFDPPPALLAWRIPGELLGDFRFSEPEQASDDWISATDECKLLRMPTSLVHELAKSYPKIYFNIARNLAAKARKAGLRAQILRLPTIDCMVAQLFIDLIAERKTTEESLGHHVLNGSFSLDELAAFIGYKKRHPEGAVSKMIRRKIIGHYRGKGSGRYEILDESKLKPYLERQLKLWRRKQLRNWRKKIAKRNVARARSQNRSPGREAEETRIDKSQI
jgi:CRP-like cAMP-binding protein